MERIKKILECVKQFVFAHKEIVIPIICVVGVMIFILCNKFQTVSQYYGTDKNTQTIDEEMKDTNQTSEHATEMESTILEIQMDTTIQEDSSEETKEQESFNSSNQATISNNQLNLSHGGDNTQENFNNQEEGNDGNSQKTNEEQHQNITQNHQNSIKDTEQICEQPTQTENTDITVYIQVDCKIALEHKDDLAKGMIQILPKDGIMIGMSKYTVKKGTTAFDLLQMATQNNRVLLDYEGSSSSTYGSVYVKGIGGLHEKDCGSTSGWMYSVNGNYNVPGCSLKKLKDGDVVKFRFTYDGFDVRNEAS